METIAGTTGDKEMTPEKLTAIQKVETYFAALRGRGNLDTALAFLSRSGGEPPRAGDEPDVLS